MAKKDKEARRLEDIARQTELAQAELNQLLAQLIPGSPEYAELQAKGRDLLSRVAGPEDEAAQIRALGQQLVSQQQATIASGGPVTALEARTGKAAEQFRQATQPVDFEEDIFRILRGEAPTTESGRIFAESMRLSPETLGLQAGVRGEPSTAPVSGLISDLYGRARAPVGDIESFDRFKTTLPERLELVRGQVENQFARRGITPTSGLALEGLGRAGIEQAIAEEAMARDAFLRASQLRQRELESRNLDVDRYLRLFDASRAIPGEQAAAAGQVFNVGEGLRERQIGLEEYLTNLQLGRETNLTGLLERSTTRRLDSAEDLLQRERAFSRDDRIAAEAEEKAQQQALMKLAAQAGSAALFLTPAAPFAPAALAAASSLPGGATQTQAPTAIPTRSTQGTDLSSLLANQQQARSYAPLSTDLSLIDPEERARYNARFR